MEKELEQQQINVEISEDIADGIYSNLAIITHSTSEFVIDFIRLMPGLPKAKVKSRIVLTPEHAKRLLSALQENIAKYEANNGTIKLGSPNATTGNTNTAFPFSFGGPTPMA